ncbi:Hsp70 family protein [Dactylosporangium sucinum]|uniref:Hsp70 family protein n=1 Tax=Dactylosporangium sucinum TaxID=1424081 RepID=UPI001E59C4BA|nr:Hsp70 family protein [Dactylosporangium sucinum]
MRPAAVPDRKDAEQDATVPLGDGHYAPGDLVAVLRAVAGRAEPADRLVLTVPASYGHGDARSHRMVAAGEAAGFAEVELLPEPVAAALGPISGAPFAAGDLVLVYDFGGGTFDAALVRFGDNGTHEVLGHAALNDCGGRDVDALIARHLRGQADPELAETLAAGAGPAGRLRPRRQAPAQRRRPGRGLPDAGRAAVPARPGRAGPAGGAPGRRHRRVLPRPAVPVRHRYR